MGGMGEMNDNFIAILFQNETTSDFPGGSGKVHDIVDCLMHPDSCRHGCRRTGLLTLLACGRAIATAERRIGGLGWQLTLHFWLLLYLIKFCLPLSI